MKIGPLKRPKQRPVAILQPGHRTLEVTTDTGTHTYKGSQACAEALAGLSGHVCYVLSHLGDLVHTTGALSWTCHLWRGRETRMTHVPSGTSVGTLRGTLKHSFDPFADLCTVLDWLSGEGVAAGSIPAMAWALWRSTLSSDLSISFDAETAQAALYGGRQEAPRPAEHSNMANFDIRAAYPVAMASRPYALSLRTAHVKSNIDPSAAGIAEAMVRVDESMPYAPLPVRLAPGMISFQHGVVHGFWPWCELAAAKALGCEVKVLQMWAPRREADLFSSWWPIIAEGRRLPGAAGVLAKAIANSTWGQFGMVATDRAVRSWTSNTGTTFVDVPEPDRTMPHQWTAHIAAETTARIRTRVLLEGLYGTCQPVYVDTDGVIVAEGSQLPADSGDEPGQWRVKAIMPKVHIRGPQMYRWTCGSECGVAHAEWHYNCAGVPDEQAPAVFARASSGPAVSWSRSFSPPPDLTKYGVSVRENQVIDQW